MAKKHTPGRDHDRKSKNARRTRYGKKAKLLREAELSEAHRQWYVWDHLSKDAKHIMTELFPKYPRPTHEN